MAYQSLYRRYRPQKFSEIRGQSHIVAALRNAVANDQVGHAYLFCGPRGTGKTSSARVLAKALNCENLGEDSEPCGTCESCVAIEQGRSFDLHELDAASNNGVEDMRDLLGKVNLGNPGRMKVYILDEVHMLTRGAENSLLKTLEEPPGHVVWVLATTEPHKVVETIRSRCQVFELGLLGAEEMTAHVRWVITDAGLDVDDDAVDYVVSVGGGSVRDTLSALDRVVAAGGVVEIDQSTDQLLRALAAKSTAGALTAVGEATGRGRDPRTIGEMLLAGLRDAFLTLMGSPPPRITAAEQERAAEIAEEMSAAQLTRALETLGTALVEMRQAPDPRVHLEVALVRLCRSAGDGSVDSLLERIEQLEARLASGAAAGPVEAASREARPAGSAPVEAAPDTAAPDEARPAVAAPIEAVRETAAPIEAVPDTAAPIEAVPVEEAPALADSPKAEQETVEPRQVRAPDTAPELPPPPQLTGLANPAGEQDIRSLQPNTAREVVALAGQHLSLGRDLVIARANSVLGPSDGTRSSEELQRLWHVLVDEFGPDSLPEVPPLAEEAPGNDPEPAPPVSDRSPVEAAADSSDDDVDDTEPSASTADFHETVTVGPVEDDGLNFDELIDASSHTEKVVELLNEAFPGAEIDTPAESRADQ